MAISLRLGSPNVANASSVTVTCAAGDIVVLSIWGIGLPGWSVGSVSGPTGLNSWTQGGAAFPGASTNLEVWYCKASAAITSGTITITIAGPGISPSYLVVSAYASSLGVIDFDAIGTGASGSASPISDSVVTSANNAVALMATGATGVATVTAGSGYTTDIYSGNTTMLAIGSGRFRATAVTPTSGTNVTATATFTGSLNWSALAFSLKESSSSPTRRRILWYL